MINIPTRRHILQTAATLAVVGLLPLHAHALDKPKAKVVLSISGKIGTHNQESKAVFDMAMLEALPQKTFTTQTPWYDKPVQFSGPLLRDVLAAVKADGSTLKAIALNDYKVNIPAKDAKQFDVVLAHRMDGQLIPVRSKGPLFIIYPFDAAPELRNDTYIGRSIWQLKAIEVE